ncbi:hypothetical protein [Sphingomonas faeni]|uniref:hypothetical protein n=1 Tax=Sphingomonas faeni TaxID=185950 RepID=UPI00335F7A00
MKLQRAMTNREVWMKASTILAEHGEMTADYIIDQLGDVLGNDTAVEDWRRVAAAVDAITGADTHGSN